MTLWIEMAEMIFQMREQKVETKIMYWMFPQKAEWRDKHNTYEDDTDNNVNNTNIDTG